MREALRLSFCHWGLHSWAVSILFGLAIADIHFRHEQPPVTAEEVNRSRTHRPRQP